MIDLARVRDYRENNRVEAKLALGGLPESLWESYSAFANTLGGVILLGVEERKDKSFRPVDLPQAEAYLREAARDVLRNLARSAMRTDAAGTLGGFGSLTIGKVSFPWLRVFEIRMEWEVSR